jgi:hypothetical protein
LFTNTTIRYITVLDAIILSSLPNVTAAPKNHPIPLHADFSPPLLPPNPTKPIKSIMTNNINANDTADASTNPVIPSIDQVPHIPLLNANKTRESFRAAFLTNPTGLIDDVFLVCNAAYGMQASIEALRASQTDVDDLQTRLENTLITKSDGDATITRLIAENETP